MKLLDFCHEKILCNRFFKENEELNENNLICTGVLFCMKKNIFKRTSDYVQDWNFCTTKKILLNEKTTTTSREYMRFIFFLSSIPHPIGIQVRSRITYEQIFIFVAKIYYLYRFFFLYSLRLIPLTVKIAPPIQCLKWYISLSVWFCFVLFFIHSFIHSLIHSFIIVRCIK